MNNEREHCSATTKAGKPCKNYPLPGSKYCRAHQSLDRAQASTTARAAQSKPPLPAATKNGNGEGTINHREFEILINELNLLAAALQKRVPSYTPPDFSVDALIALLKRSWDHFTPDMQLTLLTELRGNLEGTSPSDLVDPETWKGLWYILTYMAQAKTENMRNHLVECLSSLPGAALLTDIWHNLEGTSPREFLDPDTWRGLFLVLNYTVQGQINDLKRRVLGDEDGEEEIVINAQETG